MKKIYYYYFIVLVGAISSGMHAMNNPNKHQAPETRPYDSSFFKNKPKGHYPYPETIQFELWNKATGHPISARFCNEHACTRGWENIEVGDRITSNNPIYMLEYFINDHNKTIDTDLVENVECFTFNPDKKVLVRVGKEKSENDPTKPDPTFFGEQTGTGPGPIGELLSAIRHVFPESKGLISKTETGISLRNAANDKTDIIWIPAPELKWKNQPLQTIRNFIFEIDKDSDLDSLASGFAQRITQSDETLLPYLTLENPHYNWTIFHEIALWSSLINVDNDKDSLTYKIGYTFLMLNQNLIQNIQNQNPGFNNFNPKNTWEHTPQMIRENSWIKLNIKRYIESDAFTENKAQFFTERNELNENNAC